MKLIKVFWYILKIIFVTIQGIIFFFLAVFARIFNIRLAFDIFRLHLKICCRIFGLKVAFIFEDDSTRLAKNSVFVLLNQSSFLDSIVTSIHPIKNMRGIINIEFALYPILGWFLALTNFVIIRQWSSQAKNTLNRTDRFLRSGGNMMISIEGKS